MTKNYLCDIKIKGIHRPNVLKFIHQDAWSTVIITNSPLMFDPFENSRVCMYVCMYVYIYIYIYIYILPQTTSRRRMWEERYCSPHSQSRQ